LSDECIHGLANGLCASCFPQAAPAATAAPRVAKPRASRAREAASPTALRSERVAPLQQSRPTRSATAGGNVGEQRIYHITHIKNLPAILADGQLLAQTGVAGTKVDISSPDNREARRATPVSGQAERSVADYVPFFLSPDSSLWDSIRSHDADPRLAPGADELTTFDFVVLVSTVGTATGHTGDDGLIVTDGDAVAALSRFAATADDRERMLRALRAASASDSILDAEFLVAESFPFELVTLIGVANDKVREAVKGILAPSGFRPKVAVYPPWFQPSEVEA
jgi:hypothetical protein